MISFSSKKFVKPLPSITATSGELLFVNSKNFFEEGYIKAFKVQKNLAITLQE
mgnify:CR=1 FL=1